jgi:hypothetical protein
MRKIIQIDSAKYHTEDAHYGALQLWALCEDGSVWKLYRNARGEIWVPLRAAAHSAVSALKETASCDDLPGQRDWT